MKARTKELLDKLKETRALRESEYAELLRGSDEDARAYAASLADEARRGIYGTDVFIRGLIELTNFCRNDCLYCGIRKSNAKASRYRLAPDEIISCCRAGYELGFRTFVLQGGEDPYFTDERLVPMIRGIKDLFPDCALTLSLGERGRASYEALFEAGADRYLLRHETADPGHYAALHPEGRCLQSRMDCLRDLKAIGYQTGCGFMVGSPYQTPETLAKDLIFVQEFRPEMCGIGPFIPHADTPFAGETTGPLEMTLCIISILRLIDPCLLIPAATALGAVHPRGRELGILAGANVIMPNLSPEDAKSKYTLYDGKPSVDKEASGQLAALRAGLEGTGFSIVTSRGDPVRA